MAEARQHAAGKQKIGQETSGKHRTQAYTAGGAAQQLLLTTACILGEAHVLEDAEAVDSNR